MSIVHWDTPVLTTVSHVVREASLVKINAEKISTVADWMAYEEFAKPDGSMLFDFGNDPDVLMDFTLVVNTMNFAFTDFSTGVKFETDYMGKRWCDSEAMLACLHRAVHSGIPFFSGEYLAKLTRKDLESVFSGTIEMPMLDERVTLFNEVGRVVIHALCVHVHQNSMPTVMACWNASLLSSRAFAMSVITTAPTSIFIS